MMRPTQYLEIKATVQASEHLTLADDLTSAGNPSISPLVTCNKLTAISHRSVKNGSRRARSTAREKFGLE